MSPNVATLCAMSVTVRTPKALEKFESATQYTAGGSGLLELFDEVGKSVAVYAPEGWLSAHVGDDPATPKATGTRVIVS